MLTIVAKSTIAPAKREQFIAQVQELIALSRQEAGCLGYDLCQDSDNPNVLAFIEQWQDTAAIKAHRQSAHFKKIVPLLDGLREGAEINIYQKLV